MALDWALSPAAPAFAVVVSPLPCFHFAVHYQFTGRTE